MSAQHQPEELSPSSIYRVGDEVTFGYEGNIRATVEGFEVIDGVLWLSVYPSVTFEFPAVRVVRAERRDARRVPLSPSERIRRKVERRRRRADGQAARRAKTFGCHVGQVPRGHIRQRDEETCYLCGKWVSVHEQSLDHITPLSRGGIHSTFNCMLTHKACNSRKGDRLLSEIDFSEW